MEHAVYCGDFHDVVPTLGQFAAVFIDPPDNIGLGYDTHKDRMPEEKYVEFLNDCIYWATTSAPCVWISFNPIWTFDMGALFKDYLKKYPNWEGRACQQIFTFGQYQETDFGTNHRPLWRLQLKNHPFYGDQIRVESVRQKIGDKRANPKGRVPGDTFDFPRVTGNSKQRRAWHPTQLNEGLVEQALKSCTLEGAPVLDFFGGTGTTLRVCTRINRPCTVVDLDAGYARNIAKEHGLKVQRLPKKAKAA